MLTNWRNLCYNYYTYAMLKFIDVHEVVVKLYFQFFRNTIISIKSFPPSTSNESPKMIYHIAFSCFAPLESVFLDEKTYPNNILEIIQHSDTEIVTTLLPTKDFIAFDKTSLECDLIAETMKQKKVSKKVLISSAQANSILITSIFMKVLHSFLMTSFTCDEYITYLKQKRVIPASSSTEDELVVSDFYLDETVFKANDKLNINDGHLVK